MLRCSSGYSFVFSQPRGPDGAQRNPGFDQRIVTAPDCAALHPGLRTGYADRSPHIAKCLREQTDEAMHCLSNCVL